MPDDLGYATVEEILDIEHLDELPPVDEMITALAKRIISLEERLATEVRTRRLVVVDAEGRNRAVIECRAQDPQEWADEGDFVHLDLLSVETDTGANAEVNLYAGTSSMMIGKRGAKRRRESARASTGASSRAEGRKAFAEVGASWSQPGVLHPDEARATGTFNLTDTSADTGVHETPARRRASAGGPEWPT